MTTRPRLKRDLRLLPGLAALALFLAVAAAIVASSFPGPAGFPEDANVTASIGYALFDVGLGDVPAEGFLAAFLIVAIVLDAALEAAVYLARREEAGTVVTALTDGGLPLGGDEPGDAPAADAPTSDGPNADAPGVDRSSVDAPGEADSASDAADRAPDETPGGED